MSQITVISKQPPGGRCSLYLRYAQTLHQARPWVIDPRCVIATTAPPFRRAGPLITPRLPLGGFLAVLLSRPNSARRI